MNIFKIIHLSFFIFCTSLAFAQKVTPLSQKKYKDVCNVTSYFSYVSNGKKWGATDTKDIEIIPLDYDSIGSDFGYRVQYFNVKRNKKWGVYDTNLKKEIAPCKFNTQILFINKHCVSVTENGKWAVYNFIEKKLVTDYKYDRFNIFNDEGENGYCIFAFKDNIEYAIREDGTEKEVEKDDSFGVAPEAHDLERQFGYIVDSYVKDANLWVVVNDKGQCGVINSNQEFVIPMKYDRIYNRSSPPCFITFKNKKSILYDYTGKVIVPECENFHFLDTKCGLAFDFSINNKRQCLFKDGRTLFDNKSDEIVLIADTNYGIKRVGKVCEIITCDGQIVGTEKYDSFKIMGNNFWVLKDKNWQLVTVND